MRFPYGTADFRAIRREGYYYADRTDRIRALEQTGKQLLFLRPRRFGKTAWLTTLENYYDLARAGEFDHLLEFKYLSRKDLGQTGEQLRALPREALARLPGVAASLDDAEAQLAGHRHGLEQAYGERLHLHTHAVVALGFERLIWRSTPPAALP